jgi:hypothetical protein
MNDELVNTSSSIFHVASGGAILPVKVEPTELRPGSL